MQNRIHIRPGRIGDQVLKIRKPVGGYLAEAGEPVNDSTYWQRRQLDGDVELVPETESPKAGAKAGK